MNNFKSYRIVRALQICVVFSVVIIIQEAIHYHHAGWSGFVLMVIYGGFDNGTALLRITHRFWGTILGLLIAYVLSRLAQLNYRLLDFILPLDVFCIYFFSGTIFVYPTIFLVSASVLGFSYFYPETEFVITYFLIDYFMSTLIAFAVAIIFEYFLFDRRRMMALFIRDIQHKLISNLILLMKLLQQQKVNNTVWFNQCMIYAADLFELSRLMGSFKFLESAEKIVGEEFIEFTELANKTFYHLKALYFSTRTPHFQSDDYFNLVNRVQEDIKKLRQLTRVKYIRMVREEKYATT